MEKINTVEKPKVMKIWILLTLALAGLQTQILTGATPNRYTVVELPAAAGADFFVPRRINNRGEMAGNLDFSTGPFKDNAHAAFYRQGVTVDVHLLAGGHTNLTSQFVDLNDRGQAILFVEGDTDGRYFIYRNGKLKDLPQLPEPYYFEPVALNNAGWVAGTIYVIPANEVLQAVLYKRGAFRELGLPGVASESADINDRGQIPGRHGGDGVIFSRNRIQDLGEIDSPMRINNRGDILALASPSPFDGGVVRFKNREKLVRLPFQPSAINDRREIVGSMTVFDHDLNSHGVVHVGGITYDLNDLIDPGVAKVIYAYDINNRGQIVAWGRASTGRWSGLLLTPDR